MRFKQYDYHIQSNVMYNLITGSEIAINVWVFYLFTSRARYRGDCMLYVECIYMQITVPAQLILK